MVNEWKYEWINMQHWWNGGDSDIQLECHCTVSSFLVKLLSGEWRGIHHGYCQNVQKHYRNMSLWLSNMSAAAQSSNRNPPSPHQTHNHIHVLSCHVTAPSSNSRCPTNCHNNNRTHTYCHHYRYNLLCFAFKTDLLIKLSIYDLQPTLYISHPHKTTGKNNRFIYLLTFNKTNFFTSDGRIHT